MVPDGYYKAQWESGQESTEFELSKGKYTLYGKEYILRYVNEQIRFDWGDAHGTVQQLDYHESDGSIVWRILNNPSNKKVIWVLSQKNKALVNQEKVNEEIVETEKLQDLSGLYEIYVEGGTDKGRTLLSCRSNGLVDLWARKNDGVRQSANWYLKKLENGLYNIKVYGGTNPDY